MTYNTDKIVKSCSIGIEDSIIKLLSYLAIFNSPKVFIENIIHNFGYLFDASRDLYYFFGYDVRGRYNEPFDAGLAVGTMIWLVFKPASK